MEQILDRAANFLPRVDESALVPGRVDRRIVTLTRSSIAAFIIASIGCAGFDR